MMFLSFSTRFHLERVKKGQNKEFTLLLILRKLTRLVNLKVKNFEFKEQTIEFDEQILQTCETLQSDISLKKHCY